VLQGTGDEGEWSAWVAHQRQRFGGGCGGTELIQTVRYAETGRRMREEVTTWEGRMRGPDFTCGGETATRQRKPSKLNF
jgi:hypothetical protein